MDSQSIPVKPDRFADEQLSKPDPDLGRSMAGRNAFYHPCEVHGSRRNYAVCLHEMLAIEESRPGISTVCEAAVRAGTCPALKLRNEEIAKGHSIYFLDRTEQRKQNEEREASAQSVSYPYGRRSISSAKFVPTDPATISETAGRTPRGAIKHTIPVKSPDAIDGALAGQNLLEEGINRSLSEAS